MCNYTQREFRCNHVRWIVSRWCPLYARTQRRCPLHVTHCEYRGNEVCGMSFFFPPSLNGIVRSEASAGSAFPALIASITNSGPDRGACLVFTAMEERARARALPSLPLNPPLPSLSTQLPSTWNWGRHGWWASNLVTKLCCHHVPPWQQRQTGRRGCILSVGGLCGYT
ncbi:hypothetical protein LZ32DRAFT_256694 [Colletotrichum eremochloae]|nr:hypothetical protein LZ32DRAFT_256694 [Colletotrichum eremochloae]